MKKWIKALTVASVLAAAQSSVMAAEGRAVLADQTLVSAENASLNFRNAPAPVGLVEDLRKGGYVIVFRYTGSGGDDAAIAPELKQKVIDDGQRISKRSIERMTSYGKKYQDLGIPVNRVLSSEYYFVWQHAQAAFGNPIQISRDLTGSLNFRDKNELAQSLQNLRNRTVTPPDAGQNTILFTHQGKFDKAYGYYIPAGTTILFKPDGTSTPKLVAVLSYDEFMALK
ncbi:MAG: hypothetical protein SOX43_00960 [Pelistega sp.]|nr:hypothetical protein [Pelistega sp.]